MKTEKELATHMMKLGDLRKPDWVDRETDEYDGTIAWGNVHVQVNAGRAVMVIELLPNEKMNTWMTDNAVEAVRLVKGLIS